MAMNKLAELIGAILVVMTFVKMRLIATPHTESDDHDSSLLSHVLCAAWKIAGKLRIIRLNILIKREIPKNGISRRNGQNYPAVIPDLTRLPRTRPGKINLSDYSLSFRFHFLPFSPVHRSNA